MNIGFYQERQLEGFIHRSTEKLVCLEKNQARKERWAEVAFLLTSIALITLCCLKNIAPGWKIALGVLDIAILALKSKIESNRDYVMQKASDHMDEVRAKIHDRRRH